MQTLPWDWWEIPLDLCRPLRKLKSHSEFQRDWLLSVSSSARSCLVTQSYPTLCGPMGCSLPGSSIHGIFQARTLDRVAISFSSISSWPEDWTQVSALQADSLLTELPGNRSELIRYSYWWLRGKKTLPPTQETRVWSLRSGWCPGEGMAMHASIPAWRIPQTEKPCGSSLWGCKELDTTEWLTPIL